MKSFGRMPILAYVVIINIRLTNRMEMGPPIIQPIAIRVMSSAEDIQDCKSSIDHPVLTRANIFSDGPAHAARDLYRNTTNPRHAIELLSIDQDPRLHKFYSPAQSEAPLLNRALSRPPAADTAAWLPFRAGPGGCGRGR
jgi:hypothetical protein